MRNHKKLYRSISASLLMLFAGLVLAPTVVTAGFHAATKKPVAPTQPTQQVALEPTAHKAVKQERSIRSAEPTAQDPSQVKGEQPVPQAETEPTGHDQHDSTGPTTFAVSDFEPIHGGGAVFPRGGAGIDIATADTGATIAKVTRKPNPPTTGNDQAGTSQPDTTGAPNSNKPAGSTPPAAGGDQHDHPATDGEHHSDQHPDKPADTQLADNHTDIPADDHHDDRPHASVPEPSSIALLAAGLIGLVVARRRS